MEFPFNISKLWPVEQKEYLVITGKKLSALAKIHSKPGFELGKQEQNRPHDLINFVIDEMGKASSKVGLSSAGTRAPPHDHLFC